MQSITFDRFDAGLLLARPKSISPANSLSNLFNMDVQPGGWLRSRANWLRSTLYTAGVTGTLSLGSRVYGLRSNGGFLWSFALEQGATTNDYTVDGTFGRLYALDSLDGDYLAIGYFSLGGGAKVGRLAGASPWESGFVVVMRDDTAAAWYKAIFTVTPGGVSGQYASVARTAITDVNMPNSGIMLTHQSRVYAVSDDGQAVRFCKVGDPTDWTTAGNAGFLPVAQHFGSGQRAYGLGLYQGKLAVFTDKSVQLWTVDPDPTAMALDNIIDGIGTRHHGSIVPLNGDLLFLSNLGIRSLTTLQNSLFPTDVDMGLPVNQIAKPVGLTGGSATISPYSTVLALNASPFGQYWVAAPNDWTNGGANEFGWLAWSYSRQAKLNAWAWHGAGGTPRAKVTGWAALGNRVYIRTNKEAYLLQATPDQFAQDQTETGAYASCSVQTQWLDFGKLGRRKALCGIDFDGKNVASVSILTSADGNRTGQVAATAEVGSNQSGWTYSGEMIPLQADGTEFMVSFIGGGIGETSINRFTLYFDELSA